MDFHVMVLSTSFSPYYVEIYESETWDCIPKIKHKHVNGEQNHKDAKTYSASLKKENIYIGNL